MSLKLPEGCVCLSGPGKQSCRRGEVSKGRCYSAVFPDEPTVEVGEAKEGLELFNSRRYRPLCTCFPGSVFTCPLSMMYPRNETEHVTFLHLDVQFVVQEEKLQRISFLRAWKTAGALVSPKVISHRRRLRRGRVPTRFSQE